MLAPELSGLFEVLRIGRLAAVQGVTVVPREIELLAPQQFGNERDALLDSLQEPFEDFTRRAGFPRQSQVVEDSPVLVEIVQVGFEEIQTLAVECLQVAVEEAGGNVVIERPAQVQVVDLSQHPGGQPGDGPFVRNRFDRRHIARPAFEQNQIVQSRHAVG